MVLDLEKRVAWQGAFRWLAGVNELLYLGRICIATSRTRLKVGVEKNAPLCLWMGESQR